MIFAVSPCPLEHQRMFSNRDFYVVWEPRLLLYFPVSKGTLFLGGEDIACAFKHHPINSSFPNPRAKVCRWIFKGAKPSGVKPAGNLDAQIASNFKLDGGNSALVIGF